MFDVEYELDNWLRKAIQWRASDIHIEPMKEYVRIRFRVDGQLEEMHSVEKVYQEKVINRVKLLAHIDIGEKRLPQDGRWGYSSEGRDYTLRVSVLPTVHGEHVVIRMSYEEMQFHGLAELGMSSSMERKMKNVLQRPYGLFLVTGPTGSGKSATLYTLLSLLNTIGKHVLCLEDPVEQSLVGATQVEMNEKAGFTFAKGLRAALRQDPDVMMVGEIRDKETAQLAMQAALTGHQVFSTLHTNTSVGVMERLVDMGVEPFLVKAALMGAIAQRLVRRKCSYCETGCNKCRNTGYQGRFALYELLFLPPEEVDWEHLSSYVEPTLEEAAKNAVVEGKTTREEVLRIGLRID